jgi:hypothetical protein
MENDKTQTPYIPGYWLAALIIGWSVDLLFWGHPAGISFPIWVILAIAGLFAAAWWEHRRPAAASYVLAAISLALALTPFLRSEPFSSSITALLAVGSLGLLAATFTSGNWTLYRIGDLLLASMKLISAGLVRIGTGRPDRATFCAPERFSSTARTDPCSAGGGCALCAACIG